MSMDLTNSEHNNQEAINPVPEPMDAPEAEAFSCPPAQPGRRSLFSALAGLVLLFALLPLARLPFLSNPILGEEGYFGVMAIDDGITKLDDYRFFEPHARFQGRVYLDPMQHPIAPYLFSTQVLRRIFVAKNFMSLSFAEKSRLARLPYLCTFFTALLCIPAIYLLYYRGSRHPNLLLMLGVLAFMNFSLFMVSASIQPQADGSVGGLMVALPALLIVLAGRLPLRSPAASMLVLAGFVIGLGKNEWNMALLAALGAALIFSHLFARLLAGQPIAFSPRYRLVAWIVVGLLIGNVVSFFLEPWDYVRGLKLMLFLRNTASWFTVFKGNLPFIWPIIALTLLVVALFLANVRELMLNHFPLVVLFFYALALFCGFMLSKWPGDGFPRYFGPVAFMLLCVTAALLPLAAVRRPLRQALLLFMVLGLSIHGCALYRFHKNNLALGSSANWAWTDVQSSLDFRHQYFQSSHKPVPASVNFAYYYPDSDFIADILQPQELPIILMRNAGPRTPEPGSLRDLIDQGWR